MRAVTRRKYWLGFYLDIELRCCRIYFFNQNLGHSSFGKLTM